MEIRVPLELTEQQASLLDMHSVLNVLNVINYELIQISEAIGDQSGLIELMDKVSAAGRMLADPEQAQQLVEGINDLVGSIEDSLDASCAGLSPELKKEVGMHRENLHTIYAIIRVRAGEIMARHRSPNAWIEHRIQDLKSNFVSFLSAVEKNSHGRYRIVHNVAAQTDADYLIDFDITSDFGDKLCMPIVFQDVMRDLLANARKYTSPGGHIQCRLHASKAGLHFQISDNGMGIPNDAIEDVIRFGGRARNARHQATRGGGFGLTKAYAVTAQHHGRMWIESSADENGSHGTRIDIRLPSPGGD